MGEALKTLEHTINILLSNVFGFVLEICEVSKLLLFFFKSLIKHITRVNFKYSNHLHKITRSSAERTNHTTEIVKRVPK